LLGSAVQPSGTPGPGSPPRSAIAGVSPSRGQVSDFVLVESREVSAEPVLPAAVPSGLSTAPSPRSRLLREGARYQKLTQKEKFRKPLQPVAGTRVRRLTNADDISSFLSLLEKTSCKCKHVHTFEPNTYRYASTDVDSSALYDKIFNWGGEREVKFKILLLLQRLLNYRQPLVPRE